MRTENMRRDAQNTVYLIVHADDIGMCHSVNKTTIEAYERGVISSGSIMVPCPWFLEAAEYFRKHPELDVGIHITLTSEWKLYRWPPVAPKNEVPGLIDNYGFMYRTSKEVAEHATGKEVETEIRAQIERALEFGIKPTHLDTHMGTVHFKPEFLETYVRLAEEFGIPVLLHRGPPELVEKASSLVREMPRVVGISEIKNFDERKSEYIKMLENLKPGVNEVILHLGGDDEEIRAIIGQDAHLRYKDFLIFSDTEIKRAIQTLGLNLIGWRNLRRSSP
ncbi:polysaccharide deacetylase family protein [Candidatus Bathyarchaeota archaeon]|nr:polysaccharide deacetylase family protein [Candidatus Bathyarchaeota archaeon]